MNTLDILKEKAKKNELAHFYIVESAGSEDEALKRLMDFVHGFIRDYYHQVEGAKQSLTHLMDHPDVYVLGNLPDTEEKDSHFFTVAEAEAFSRFFEFRPVQGKRKFAVITEGHRINTIVANKWLKLLEEPQGITTIFLLNPRGQKLLDTIHSRALHLRLPVSITPASLEDWHSFILEIKQNSLSQILELHQKSDLDVSYWTQKLILWESQQLDQTQGKIALDEWLKMLQEMEVFHQPSATKWTLFYSYLHEHVLPRLSH